MYKKNFHIHFVGIGGIGMSGIATILKYQGYEISGCDLDLSQKSIQNLMAIGCKISEGHNSETCTAKSIGVLVYSSAIKADSPEIKNALQNGIPIIPRALMLAELMRTKYSIAITGSHGKTTTTSMISHILMETRMDPTIIIGGHLKSISNNAKIGLGDFLVAEADESDRSLLNLHPTLAVITNIDLEHLETYKDFDDIKNTFKAFLNNIPFYGKAIVCIDDPGIEAILPIAHIKTTKYGIENAGDIRADSIELFADYSKFNVWYKDILLGNVVLNMPGKHNILNSLAAIAVGLDLELSFEKISAALNNFKGVDRRFTYHGLTASGAEIFDDYGHHPNEIMNTLITAKRRAKNGLKVIFQPHRYSRTSKLWLDFINVFLENRVKELIITDIYAASESPIDGVTSTKLVEDLKRLDPTYPVQYMPYDKSLDIFAQHIEKTADKDELILLLGAGRLNLVAPKVVQNEN